MIWLAVTAIFALIILSGFFSGSETAMTAASKERLHSLAKEGNWRAKMVGAIRKRKERMIGALLLGNNLVNILASAIATSVFIKLFGEVGVVYATLVMTMLVLIFAEVLPKTYALQNADKMAMFIAPFIRVVIWLFAPITEMVTWIVSLVLKICGVHAQEHDGEHVEILKGAIEMHHAEGDEEISEQRAMLRSILDLADVDVEDIMIHRKNVEIIDGALPIDEIVKHVLESAYTRLPVYEGEHDNIIGVIHVKQLLRKLHDSSVTSLQDVLQPPWFIPETTNLFDQLQAFRDRKGHFALVVDEYGTFMGVVTLEDILEEIVGEIDDEHDQTVEGVQSGAGGSYIVDGAVTIRDLNREFEWSLPDEDYATIAGLVLFESQSLPEIGQTFIFHSFRFEVLKRQRNQITLVRLTPPQPEDSPADDRD